MSEKSKIGKEAFIYLEPKKDSFGPPERYAQCGTCTLWTGEERNRCYILGKDLEVTKDDTCCLYCNGEPQIKVLSGNEVKSVTVEESGFYRGEVRCENCIYFNHTISACKLFFILDSEFPDDFDLGSQVHKYGCCNANIPLKFKGNKKDAISRYMKKFFNKEIDFNELLK